MLGGFADTVKESTITIMNQALGWVEQAVFVNQSLLHFLPWKIQSILVKDFTRISRRAGNNCRANGAPRKWDYMGKCGTMLTYELWD